MAYDVDSGTDAKTVVRFAKKITISRKEDHKERPDRGDLAFSEHSFYDKNMKQEAALNRHQEPFFRDHFDESVEVVAELLEEGVLTRQDARFLLRGAFRVHMKREQEALRTELFPTTPRKTSVFLDYARYAA